MNFTIFSSLKEMIAYYLLGPTESEISDFVCTACEGTDLTTLAKGVYRCNQCGYQGGSGMADWLKEKRRHAVDEISGEQRKERVVKNLSEARRLVTSALGTIDGGLDLAETVNALTVNSLSADRHTRQHRRRTESEQDEGATQLIKAMQLLTEAHELADESAYLMGLEVPKHLHDSRENLVGETSQLNAIGNSTAKDLRDARRWGELLQDFIGELSTSAV